MAAIIKPLPSGGSDDVTGHEWASCSTPKVYGADFGDVSDWSEEVKDSETADDGDDEEEKVVQGRKVPNMSHQIVGVLERVRMTASARDPPSLK